MVNCHDQHSGTTRFANNQVVQNVDTRRGTLTVTVAFDRSHGSASTTDFTAGAVQETLTRAERIAPLSPEDPEYLPPPEPQVFPTLLTSRPRRAAAGPSRRLEYANEAIGQCRMENLQAAGIVSSSVASVGVAASNGLLRPGRTHRCTIQPHGSGRRCHRLECGGPSFHRSPENPGPDLVSDQQGQAGPRRAGAAAGALPGHLGAGGRGGTLELDALDAGCKIL